jgi:2-polyprenyl-3-methyl-5-hydroxy-6-metoxy-1,4-benzoquinol methylase
VAQDLIHDFAPGPVTMCQVCNSKRLKTVIDLGFQPLCDSLLTPEELAGGSETHYPLRLVRCLDCTLTQLDYALDGSTVYRPSYPYKAGVTQEVVEHHRDFAKSLTTELGLTAQDLVLDIGCNDGTLLGELKNLGVRVLGVEPTNVGAYAREKGIDVVQSFFTEAVANDLAQTRGRVSLITMTNVFAHMATLGEVMRGCLALLKDDGYMVTETHYLTDIIHKTQYDTIYHEHPRTYSLRSLVRLYQAYGLEVVEANRVERYAGTLRVVARRGKHKPGASVSRLLAEEASMGLDKDDIYDDFVRRVQKSKIDLLKLAITAKESGKSFVGNSCPGRCSTLLNYVGLGSDLMPYIAEQPASLKLGKFLPGLHTPIVNNQRLVDEQPDYIVLLAWHYADPIKKLLRQRGVKSKLVLPLPEVTTLAD